MTLPTTCIIGDIHGCSVPLQNLIDTIGNQPDTFIFLGDYIDRGPSSQDVVEIILDLKKTHPRVITLLGNHEYMLLNYLEGLDDSIFLRAGGRQTLASYGLDPAMPLKEIQAGFPRNHLAFFQDLPLLWDDQYGIYVHAGLRPGLHLSRQTSDWCLWVRDEFIHSSHDFGKPVVFGHTVFPKPLIQKNKIGIDTGAVYGKTLTALLLPEKKFITVPGEQKHPYPTSL